MKNHTSWSDTDRAILDTRSRALAAAPPPDERPTIDMVRFVIAGERYALEARHVHGIARMTRLAPLPHTPPEIAGLMSRAGVVLPVFHLRALLDVPLAPLREHGRVIFVGDDEPELGLIAELVEAVHAVDTAKLQPAPAELDARVRTFIRGLAPGGVLLLDSVALLSSERLYVNVPLPL